MKLLSKSDIISGQSVNTIIDALEKRRVVKTPAQVTNILPPTAAFYDKWRAKSLGLLTGEAFSLEDEAQLLIDWLKPKVKEVILDLGCSTAFYARTIAKEQPASFPVAIDYSKAMLNKAIKLTKSQNRELYFLKADAEGLPIKDETINAAVSGGTLNEFHNPRKALSEAYRVLKKDGRLFLMYLTKSETFSGKLAQLGAKGGGITFHSRDGWNTILQNVGFEELKRKDMGVVTFQLLQK